MKNILGKNINFSTAIVILITVCQYGCKKWLDVKVDKKQTVPSNVEDFQAMLDDYSTINTTPTIVLREVASDGHYYSDGAWLNMAGTKFKNAYAWANDPVYSNLSDWQNPYATIFRLNIILDESLKIGDINPSLQNVMGQALFQRARMFYELSQTFSPPYTDELANEALGIPLRISSDVSVPSIRSTISETYRQITTDLNKAVDLLHERPDYITRASKLAAYGLLSRVYLTMNKFDSAYQYANKYLSISDALLKFDTLSLTANFIGINPEVAFVNFYTNISQLNSNYLIDPDLFNSYNDNDLRKKIFFRESGGAIRFKGSYGNATNDIFAGIATDEIYLIRAECRVRNGDIHRGMIDLNDLVRTRYRSENDSTTYVDQIASNEEEALRIIFNERRKELILRNVRWSDLRRLNQDSRFATILTRIIAGETYTLEPNSYKYTFPIPNDILQKTKIHQNPGWEK